MNNIPSFRCYGRHSSLNYGIHTIVLTDAQGNEFYYSYETLVAFRTRTTGLVVHKNIWGPTTGGHLDLIDSSTPRVDADTFKRALANALKVI
jgi:hypothetical protein